MCHKINLKMFVYHVCILLHRIAVKRTTVLSVITVLASVCSPLHFLLILHGILSDFVSKVEVRFTYIKMCHLKRFLWKAIYDYSCL
jgi:hypothetical protein